jgi:hypothetical protein
MDADTNSAQHNSSADNDRDAKIVIQNVNHQTAQEIKNIIFNSGIREEVVEYDG